MARRCAVSLRSRSNNVPAAVSIAPGRIHRQRNDARVGRNFVSSRGCSQSCWVPFRSWQTNTTSCGATTKLCKRRLPHLLRRSRPKTLPNSPTG